MRGVSPGPRGIALRMQSTTVARARMQSSATDCKSQPAIRGLLLINRHYTSDPPPWHRLRYRMSTTVRSVADKMEERSPVSVAEAVGKLVFVAAAFVAIFVLYVFLADKPFGIQIATIITYTGSIFCLVFFRWRWLNEAYSLRTKQVRQQLPRLMAIHLAFLLSILVVLTAGLLARPRLPN